MKPGSHLTTEALIDLAERAREESSAPHLQSCEACRHQLAVLRTAMSAAAEVAGVDVPEPSPLFWKHLSQRVHEAVAAEGTLQAGVPAWGWIGALPSGRGWAVAGVAAALMLSIYFTTPRPSQPSDRSADMAAVPSEVAAVPLPVAGTDDDPALALVADLTSQMDQDAFDETGWTSHAGAADEAVDTLTDDERLELQRLLKEELAKS